MGLSGVDTVMIPTLLLAAALLFSEPVDQLVLRSGHTIDIDGAVQVKGSRALFRSVDGTLYSIPLEEIDQEATWTRSAPEKGQALDPEAPKRSFKVSEPEKLRLLKKLEASHMAKPVESPAVTPLPKEPDNQIEVTERDDEEYWRQRARAFDAGVDRRREDLQYLIQREERLQDEIRMLMNVGYQPSEFGYQVFKLQSTREQIERGQIELRRAEEDRDQFYDDARRQNILPGWLR